MSLIPVSYEESAVSRMLKLIERHAPRLMREGGGALRGEAVAPRKLTEDQRAKIMGLGRAGKMTALEIAHAVGCRQAAAWQALHRAGITVPLGGNHAGKNRKGRAA